MWDEIIIKALIAFVPSVGSYFVASYKTKYEAEKKKQEERDELSKNLTKAVQLIMRRDLRTDAKEYLAKDSLTAEEAMEFEEYYSCYERLGKNGRIDNLVQRVRSLPIHNK